jgi:hypothetical protein
MVFGRQVVAQDAQRAQMNRPRAEQLENYWEPPPEASRGNSMKGLAFAQPEPTQAIIE